MAELVVDRKRGCLDQTIALEREAGNAAKCRDILILLAYRFFQFIDFNGAGLLGKFARMNNATRMRMERAEQSCSEASRRAKSGAGRDISERGDFNLHWVELELLE